tara:strand:- start:1633 stop:2562 length:930 start_codon:yes stop_codon:yes gene_type:complete
MNLFKPKFWDKNEVSFFSLLLLPISILVIIFSYLKKVLSRSKQFPIPIICVGNIYLGGTGKTPLCIEIFSILKSLRMNPAFVRKKYDSFQDEVGLQKLVGPIYQNKKRIAAIEEATQNDINVIILDDGFQDFSISKNLSIVCFNEKQWIGNGHIIPAGPLRETLFSLKRANFVVINGNKNKNIESKILDKNKDIKIFYTKYVPQNINEFKDNKVIAFAGIGNPKNFFDLLKENKINLKEEISFPDHYAYSENDLKTLLNKIQENNTILLTTEKDYFRIAENYKKNIKYLKIKTEIENRSKFVEEIKKII